ncbi:MAG: TrkA C-terminal domain-containing protein [Methanothrix sp.]|nr:TrkA C-terminal domain-containing protein [Methanothrix sp.]
MDLGLQDLGIKPLAVHRGMDTLNNPDIDLVLSTDDIIILMGPEENIHKMTELFSSGQDESA